MTSVSGSLFGSKTLVYDDENRLTSIAYGGVTDLYYYNWQGQRYRARLSEAYWRYEYNGDPVMEENRGIAVGWQPPLALCTSIGSFEGL